MMLLLSSFLLTSLILASYEVTFDLIFVNCSKSLTVRSSSCLNSREYFAYFLAVARSSVRALVYFVVSNISSKIFLRFD
jgi:hypothetical protein